MLLAVEFRFFEVCRSLIWINNILFLRNGSIL